MNKNRFNLYMMTEFKRSNNKLVGQCFDFLFTKWKMYPIKNVQEQKKTIGHQLVHKKQFWIKLQKFYIK